MRVILIGPGEQAALRQLREHAEAHPVSTARILRMASKAEPPIGDVSEHRLELPGGLRIVLSLEEQPGGLTRHVSLSVAPPTPGRLPNPAMVEILLPLLGFTGALTENKRIWVEGDVAINILQEEPEERV
jgi:hypothetical protein